MSAQPSPTATQGSAFADIPTEAHVSSDRGDPRSAAYWMVWNTCAPENRAAEARANGGRAAGWVLLDDLLTDPGILVGVMAVETCQQGVSVLREHDLQGVEHKNDPAYGLAAQLLAAQLNLAVGSEFCIASDKAVVAAQLLLLELGYNGTGGYLGPPHAGTNVETARMLAEQLANYNAGALCR